MARRYAVGGDGVSLEAMSGQLAVAGFSIFLSVSPWEAVPLTMDVTADSGCFMAPYLLSATV